MIKQKHNRESALRYNHQYESLQSKFGNTLQMMNTKGVENTEWIVQKLQLMVKTCLTAASERLNNNNSSKICDYISIRDRNTYLKTAKANK